MSATRDFAVSLVSLQERRTLGRMYGRICSYVLDDIQGGEQYELCFVVLAHPLDVRFDSLDYVFPVL